MKIAQVAPPWIPIPPKHYGGTENVIYNLIEAQVALGHEVTLLAPADARTSARQVSFFPQSLNESGVPWQAHLKAYYHLHNAIGYVQEHEFDIVHTHLSSTADLYVFPLTASLTTPHVTTLHSHFPFDGLSGGWHGDADEYYMKWAPCVPLVAISESARREEERGYSLNFVGVVHHGIPLEDFPLPNKDLDDYFVWLGRFTPEKATHLAIEVARQAQVPLVLAGTIDRYSQKSMSYFHEVIKPQIDGDQIRYIGPVNLRQKIHLLGRARGFLNPIEWEEPFGMVIIEAMALGCPVISFARGSALELIVHGKTGFLVQDVDEMVRFMSRVNEIGRDETRRHIERNFSARAMAEKYVEVYKKVIELSRSGSASDLHITKYKPLATS